MTLTEAVVRALQWLHSWPYLDNLYWSSLVIILIAAVFGKVLLIFFNFYVHHFAKRTLSKVDDIIFEYTKKPLFLLILVVGLKVAVFNLRWNGTLSRIIDSALITVGLYLLVRVMDIIIEGWGMSFAQKSETKLDEVLLPIFHKIGKVVFVIIAVLAILHLWGIDLTPYLAGVGISGIILGLALQDSLKNIFGGISLIVDGTYQVGDKIKLESGEIGVIHEIGLRSTKIVTYDHEVIYVPNGYIANSRVMNFTHPEPKVRSKVEFGVAYGSEVEKVKKLVLSTIAGMKDVLRIPEPEIQFYEMGDFALKFRVYFWVERWNLEVAKRAEATEKIYDALQKAKIIIPFPTQTLYVKAEKNEHMRKKTFETLRN